MGSPMDVMVHTAIKIQLVHMQLCGYFSSSRHKDKECSQNPAQEEFQPYNMIVL